MVVANGAPPSKKLFNILAERSGCLIAVDGGLQRYRRADITPDLLIGDLDSVSADDQNWIQRRKTKTLPRRNQDATDLEKTLLYCRQRNWKSVAVLSVNGNRPDHYLNGLDLAFKLRGLSLHYFVDDMLLIPLTGSKALTLDAGTEHTLSWFGFPHAAGCELRNVAWPFNKRTLLTGSFQSVSNRTLGPVVIRQKSGRSIVMISLKPERK